MVSCPQSVKDELHAYYSERKKRWSNATESALCVDEDFQETLHLKGDRFDADTSASININFIPCKNSTANDNFCESREVIEQWEDNMKIRVQIGSQ